MKKRKLILIVVAIIAFVVLSGWSVWFFSPRTTTAICQMIGGHVNLFTCLSGEALPDAGKECKSDDDCMSGQCRLSPDVPGSHCSSGGKVLFNMRQTFMLE